MAKNTQRDRVWVTALKSDNFTKHDIINRADAGDRTVHDVLKTMIDAELLNQTTECCKVERGDNMVIQEVTVYRTPDTQVYGMSESVESDARYVIGCPECRGTKTRQIDSKVVKEARQKKRTCDNCDTRVELIKDNRPNPPICPKCDEEAIDVIERESSSRYIHEIYPQDVDVINRTDSCYVQT
jgi:hypothetical protein